jgi:thioredoxin-like negative regulator of GroEL
MESQEIDRVSRAGVRFQIAVWEEILDRRPDDTEALRFLAHAYTQVGRLEEGLGADRRLAELLPRDPRVRYNLACSLALSGDGDGALAELARACELGFDDLNLLRRDQDFESLRDHPEFLAVCNQLERDTG